MARIYRASIRLLLAGYHLSLVAGASTSAVLYVNANAAGPTHDGTAWSTAFLTVQEALNAGYGGDDVWVAKSEPASPAYVESITLPTDVGLYGGFAGTETDRGQRDVKANVTILDGNNTTSNVVSSSVKGAVVDGFTVRNGGNAIRVNSTTTITNCTIQGNGTGIFVPGGTATITDCTISGNTNGSGVYVDYGGTATITNCTISGNYYGVHGTATITDCTVSNNGTGIDVFSGTVTMTNCVVTSNTTGIFTSGGTANVSNSAISGNTTGARVGGTATIANCTLSGNSTAAFVSGMATLTNCTISGNTIGSGVYVESGGTASVTNSIVAFNSTGIYLNGGKVMLSHNDVYGSSPDDFRNIPDPTGTNGNISQDPRFVSRTGGDFHLTSGSPCIDAGDDTLVTAGQRDAEGRPRIVGAHVDMGAFESGTIDAYTLHDGESALASMGGLSYVTPSDFAHLNADRGGASADTIDMFDVVWIVRRATGLDPS
ncbi:MAG TPA: right-handed parallel beta-helix repeat-containing protein [Armatimonadota bacterium]|jgi:hypothetical protein